MLGLFQKSQAGSVQNFVWLGGLKVGVHKRVIWRNEGIRFGSDGEGGQTPGTAILCTEVGI